MQSRKANYFNKSPVARLVLLIAGFSAVGIAAAILLAPEAFYASYGIALAGDINLANELKAPMGLLVAAGLLMLAGAFRADLTVAALAIATAVYLSYGLSRVSSIAIDGLPHGALVGAAAFELLVGAACLVLLLHARKRLR
jgi:hypothetical protein